MKDKIFDQIWEKMAVENLIKKVNIFSLSEENQIC